MCQYALGSVHDNSIRTVAGDVCNSFRERLLFQPCKPHRPQYSTLSHYWHAHCMAGVKLRRLTGREEVLQPSWVYLDLGLQRGRGRGLDLGVG